jgi:beta-mannosidase
MTTRTTRQPLNDGWQLTGPDAAKPLTARVPGCVHTDLRRHGLIDDPFAGENEVACRWVAERDWEYRLRFAPGPEILARDEQRLHFHGLDTLATVRLNGRVVLEADNMFRPWACDVRGLLQDGENELHITFHSPVDPALKSGPLRHLEYPADNDQLGKISPFVRKAPYHYGWDWGPALATMGIWRPVELVAWDRWRVRDVTLRPVACTTDAATFALRVDLDVTAPGAFVVEVSEPRRGVLAGQEFTADAPHAGHTIAVVIGDPELWWPRGVGDQPLCDLTVTVREAADPGAMDQRTVRTACRSIELRRETDPAGESFEFVVNGRPVFIKGANMIPAHAFPTEVRPDRYRQLVDAAAWANMNMLRVWGGGIYESDLFYDLCDESGILVWQDFMFACSLYPGHDAFLDSVEAEARFQVRRLQHHPSLALWCGNNEIAQAWHRWGWKDRCPPEMFTRDYRRLFHGVLPRVLAELDPDRPWWPTSPATGDDLPLTEQHLRAGDVHSWDVWHGGDPPTAYDANVGRFMSEYGMQSFPDPLTVEDFLPRDQWPAGGGDGQSFLEHPVLAAHQKSVVGNAQLARYVEGMFGAAPDLETFIHLSQLTQMEAMRLAIEAHRRRQDTCGGTLYWQLNDCWPGPSWSGLDSTGRLKALHYAARRLFDRVLVCFRDDADGVRPVLVHDGPDGVAGILRVRLVTLTGDVLHERFADVTLAPRAVHEGDSLDLATLGRGHDSATICAVAEWIVDGREAGRAHHHPVASKDLALPPAAYETSWSREDGAAVLTVRAASFLKWFFVRPVDMIGHFSDNYVDLLPGEERRLVFHGPRGGGDRLPAIRCLTLNDLIGGPAAL